MIRIAKALQAARTKREELDEKEGGFTLIELLVVVLIIGILAAIAIPIFLGQQESARDSAVASAVTNAKTAVVAELVTGERTLGEIITDLNTDGDLPSFSSGADITITAVTEGEGFRITGRWGGADGTNVHEITDTTSATPVAPAT